VVSRPESLNRRLRRTAAQVISLDLAA
jgi:hypothetical protein